MKTPSSSSLLAIAAAAIHQAQAQPKLDNCNETTGPGLQSNSLYYDQKRDSEEYILVQISGLTDVKFTSETECGVDSYHIQSALVLEVNRTVKEDSSFVGDAVGVPLKDCDVIAFQTNVKEWNTCCAEPEDPGIKETGWCGYVYLNPSNTGELTDEKEFKYMVSAGGQSFEAVDENVCASKLKELSCGKSGARVVSLEASIVAIAVMTVTLLGIF
jgi:hypothetical protein